MNLNSVCIGGNLVKDPEIKYTPSGVGICSFTVAINRKWKDKDGTMKEEVSFIGCTAFGKLAEIVAGNAAKGGRVIVEGRLKQERWEKGGRHESRTKVVAETVNIIDWKNSKAAKEELAQGETLEEARAAVADGPTPDESLPF